MKTKLLGGFALCLLALGACLLIHQPAAAAASKTSVYTVPVTIASSTPPKDRADKCAQSFLGLEPWYEYIPQDFGTDPSDSSNHCSINCFNILNQSDSSDPNDPCQHTASDIPAVLLAIIDDMLRISSLVALGFIFYGAFQYVISEGNSEKAARSLTTIISALAGLAIAIVAITFVQFVGSKLRAGT